MQAAESRRGRTSSADTRTPSGEVPSIEVGIGESNGQFITMRGIPTYSYALNHRGAALPRESGRPTGGARVPDFWAARPGPRDSPQQADVPGTVPAAGLKPTFLQLNIGDRCQEESYRKMKECTLRAYWELLIVTQNRG